MINKNKIKYDEWNNEQTLENEIITMEKLFNDLKLDIYYMKLNLLRKKMIRKKNIKDIIIIRKKQVKQKILMNSSNILMNYLNLLKLYKN